MKSRVLISIGALLLATAASASVKTGVDAWDRGDYATAIKEWRTLAIAGDADAQFNLAQAYKLGRGVPSDLKIAQDWYHKAAAQGHLKAEDALGLIMFQNGERQKAMPYIEKSANRGDARAQYVLGTALFNGDMVQKDWIRAYALMTRASAAGLAPASASLAQMDKYIPLEQRQKGLAMARDLEDRASKPMLAANTPSPTPTIRAPRPTGPAIRPQDVPPSQPVTFPAPPPPVMTKAPPVIVATRPPPPPAPKPIAKPTPKPVVKETVSGPAWRVQLGAFGDQGNARNLWSSLESRVSALGGLQPYLVKAGAVTRLQAGPLASKASAERLCATLKASGQGCLPVSP